MDAQVADGRSDFEKLQEDGYVVVRGGLSDEACDRAAQELDEFKERNRTTIAANLDEADRLRRVVNLHLAIDSFASLFSRNRALALCDEFFGAETVLYTSLFFERGSEQDLHRDSPAFVTKPPGKYLGVWAALEDVDAENGPLMAVPRSHLLPDLDVEAMATELYGAPENAPEASEIGWTTYQAAVRAQADAASLTAVELHVDRGDVIVWHPQLFHGGAAHRSPTRTRRSLVMHVTPLGMPVYHQDVFFDPGKDVPGTARWRYYEHDGRQIAKFDVVDFAHEFSRRADSLRPPAAGGADRLGGLTRDVRRKLSRVRASLKRG